MSSPPISRGYRIWDHNLLKMIVSPDEMTGFFLLLNGDIKLIEQEDKTLDGLQLLQSTGKQDCDGLTIFEGDICQAKVTVACICKEMTGEVVYDYDTARYELKDHESSVPLSLAGNIKIYGNIYENPERLKAQ